jgi:Zn-dependent protease with chaperone function
MVGGMMIHMAKVWMTLLVRGSMVAPARAERDQQREKTYAAELEAQSSALAARFHQATAAMDARRWPEAEGLIAAVERDEPTADTAALAAQLALERDNRPAFKEAVQKLRDRDAGSVRAHYFSAISALMDERLEDADQELTLAEAGGFPPEEAARLRELSGIRRHRQVWHFAGVGGVALAVWLLGLLGVWVVGGTLSRRTLAAIDRFDGSSSDDLSASTGALRRAYSRTIGAAAVYYFISIPVLIAVVLLGAGGIIYGFFLLGRIPIKLVLLVGLAALVSVWAMLKSLVIRRGADEDPGRPLTEAEAPGLWALLREVAGRVGTRPVEAVYLTVGTDLAVLERGSMSARLRDRAKRSLLLGVGILPGFTRKQLRAVLAHEYGHFSHRDTAGGDVAMVVQASLFRSLMGIAQAGGATFYNPAWHFLRGFHALFLRVTLGASRLQEIMADHFAAVAYGAEAFKEGLTHVVRRSLEFSRDVDVLVNQAQQAQRPVTNLYESPAAAGEDLDKAFAERMQDKGSPYDSHPPPGQRIAWVTRVPARPEHATSDDGPAWELFANRQTLEGEMTTLANNRLRDQGVIPRSQDQ